MTKQRFRKKTAAKSKGTPSKADDVVWVHSWNTEVQLPQRQKMSADGKKLGNPELGLAPEDPGPDEAGNDDPITARFVDGSVVTIESKTWGELRKIPRAYSADQGDLNQGSS